MCIIPPTYAAAPSRSLHNENAQNLPFLVLLDLDFGQRASKQLRLNMTPLLLLEELLVGNSRLMRGFSSEGL